MTCTSQKTSVFLWGKGDYSTCQFIFVEGSFETIIDHAVLPITSVHLNRWGCHSSIKREANRDYLVLQSPLQNSIKKQRRTNLFKMQP